MILLKTNLGDITITLNHDKAPNTSQNFLDYVNAGFYNNTIFHRVIQNFMIQGGGFDRDMQQKSTNPPIENEANNGLKNKRGTIAMARTSDPHSASAQFFINVVDNDFLNFKDESMNGWGYCVFGEVTDGLDVIDQIKQASTTSTQGHQDVPIEPIVIESASVVESD